MRIDAGLATSQAVLNSAGDKGIFGGRSCQAGSAASEDDATLSSGEAAVGVLEAKVQSMPEIRQQKVESLRRAVLEGTYQVRSKSVASAMFAELLPVAR